MAAIGRALGNLARERDDLLIVFPVHLNPLVGEAIRPSVEGLANVVLIDPLDYVPFVALMARSDIILTDSGGIQEEGPSLGKPVLVMRENTERPEAVEAGTARLVGTDPTIIEAEVHRLLDDPAAYAAMANAVNPYGDGRAAERSLAAIAHFLGRGPRPEEFRPT